jgi:hypothetical protein
MDNLLKGVGETLLALGLPGIVIIGLAYAVFNMFKLYTEVQEKRIDEAREGVKALEANTSALESLSDLIRERKG